MPMLRIKKEIFAKGKILVNYSVQEITFNDIPAIQLINKKNNSAAVIAIQGATLIDLKINTDGNLIEVIDGYLNLQELKSTTGSRSAIMAPFSNRLKDNRYIFQGEVYKLSENPAPPKMHGFVKYENFTVTASSADDSSATVILLCSAIREGKFPGYPFNVDVRVEYRLTEESLSLSITGINKGEKTAPYAAGWHPYFKMGNESVDTLSVLLNAESIILTDENYVPLEGEKAYGKLDNTNPFYFGSDKSQRERILSDKKVNFCYSGLLQNSNSISQALLMSDTLKTCLTITNSGNVFYIFTADGLAVRPRGSVAIEPVEFMTNGFNRPEYAGQLVLKPGAAKTFTAQVKWSQL